MTLALIAGTGDLPPALIEALDARPLVCALEGFEPAVTPDLRFRLEHLGSLLATLKDRGVRTVCMAGAVRRPAIDPAAIDAQTAPLVPTILSALRAGDDGALRAVISIFEGAGFAVRPAHKIAPDLLPPAGVSVGHVPEAVRADVRLGDTALRAMGQADLGQACVIRGGAVLAREQDAGTDALLEGLTPGTARGGFLFKGPKPDQDRRADLPVIGPRTVLGADAAGLCGIVIEAEGVMVLHRAEVEREMAARGLFLWVRERPAP
ncbi:LpxI family protein [Thalassorhabdomicrobium marinisediminis]|uniref:DUF1009 domain-containing protein n=1 Tax=Thalassorhabdomicrobium marinisediminis TaxID=2170577 RepID=A0A2T7FV78_9RHOB|nr:UDP-2,3-diacylglucosamine diphosphatase LpxI [Thalassorhabdomicrobium marinisediminis]PVA06067.1 DUF1009 domain-containing protein [Thalassorhabdomicrobium marinisediminis]